MWRMSLAGFQNVVVPLAGMKWLLIVGILYRLIVDEGRNYPSRPHFGLTSAITQIGQFTSFFLET